MIDPRLLNRPIGLPSCVLANRHDWAVKPQTPGDIAALLGIHGFFNKGHRDWLSIKAANGGTAEIAIYEEIGFDPFSGEGVTAKRFEKELKALGNVEQINLVLNSPGGDVFDGLGIYNQLLHHPAQIHVRVDGIAASAASFIAMAGDTVTMAESSMMMIHDAWGLCVGSETDHVEFASSLEKVDGEIASTYARRSRKPADTFRALMDKETWLTAQEAVDHGLADRVAVSRQRFAARFDSLPQNS